MSGLLTVHDPCGYPPKVEGKRLAQRLPNLDGKTILSGRLPVRQLRSLHGSDEATGLPNIFPLSKRK